MGYSTSTLWNTMQLGKRVRQNRINARKEVSNIRFNERKSLVLEKDTINIKLKRHGLGGRMRTHHTHRHIQCI